MESLLIRGIPVEFPYKPYSSQLRLMDQILGAISTGQNALLESPTGTGKTLCLLTATLAWQQYQKTAVSPSQEKESRGPLVIYASRTHSQLAQVVGELGKTGYRPAMAIVASREQLCINSLVKSIPSPQAQNAVCGLLTKRGDCEYHHQTKKDDGCATGESENSFNSKGSNDLMDIEELVKWGIQHRSCPYYKSRSDLEGAELVLLPYNYLVDRKSFGGLGKERLRGAIVIFDEAHNLASSCGDASSTSLTTADLHQAIRECEAILSNEHLSLAILQAERIRMAAGDNGSNNNGPPPLRTEDVQHLRDQLMRLQSAIEAWQLPRGESGVAEAGSAIFEMLGSAMIAESTAELCKRLAAIYLNLNRMTKSNALQRSYLHTVESFLRTVYGLDGISENTQSACTDDGRANNSKFFCMYLQEESISNSIGKPLRTLSYWCLNPGVVMRRLAGMGIQSFLLASGTLSPLGSFAAELEVPFPWALENEHIIGPEQIFVGAVGVGPSGSSVPLNGTYAHRSDDAYRREIGLAILETARRVPDGMLIFFPTYNLLQASQAVWQQTGIWAELGRVKAALYTESTRKGDLPSLIAAYEASIKAGGGAILFGVCRGKISEGIDFSDAKARAVVVVSIPYAPLRDPKITIKRRYLEERAAAAGRGANCLSADEWYSQQALRAVNQAIGRVIRHARDFGAILLFDQRFQQSRIQGQLSRWLRPYATNFESFDCMMDRLESFFSFKLPKAAPISKPKPIQLPSAPTDFESTKREFLSCLNNTQSQPRPASPSSTADGNNSLRISTILKPNTAKKDHPEKAEIIQKAQEYLSFIGTSLPGPAVRTFNGLLRQYRAKQISLPDLTTTLFGLFAEHSRKDDRLFDRLVEGFRQFVPTKHHPTFDKLIEEAKAAKAKDTAISNAPSGKFPVKVDPVVERALARQSVQDASGPSRASESRCPICRESPIVKPFKAKCGHVCCFACWREWLGRCLECPLCRQRTRLSQLAKVYHH